MSGVPHTESIQRMEQDGTMDRRRRELRGWFAGHPNSTPRDAADHFDYTFADHMLAVADSIWMDMRRDRRPSLSLLQGGDEDQARRLARFRERYPQVTVERIRNGRLLQARIPEPDADGETVTIRRELRDLLDKLASLGYPLDSDAEVKAPGSSEAPDTRGGHYT